MKFRASEPFEHSNSKEQFLTFHGRISWQQASQQQEGELHRLVNQTLRGRLSIYPLGYLKKIPQN